MNDPKRTESNDARSGDAGERGNGDERSGAEPGSRSGGERGWGRNASFGASLSAALGDFQQRLGDLLRNSPAADVERNLRAMSAQFFDRLDLVTRDELDAQRAIVERLSQRVEALEAALEAMAFRSAPPGDGDG